ncbi:hypothetical protein MF271_19240 (plasmid) [Deinococcus sp. KNUC1210]|uniref:hypothetical protein n=1 Tax=Deinococcus sp. KNUC1210 TaxID=2917691 RepID=UPI001EF014EB|nr:hypothetical protein [Deinococcus sp. KNUC1210]ULH17326.1 hypothetical protein MF271_19240 [Deinococcus sp. KNUC1210]
MNLKSPLMPALTAALGSTATTQDSATAPALIAWVSEYEPQLLSAAQQLLSSPFNWAEIGKLAEVVNKSVRVLNGIFQGTDRAKVSQAVLVLVVQETIQLLPEPERTMAGWVLPLLQGPAVAAVIEAAYQRVFGVGKAPVVDAPELPSGVGL